MTEYNIKVTKQEAQVIVDACDLYHRIGRGQLDNILSLDALIGKKKPKAARMILDALAQLLFDLPTSGTMTHVLETDEQYKIACDLYQVIRHRLAWDERPEGGYTVNFHEPLKISATQHMATITKVEE